jgi:hypothetical protein
VPVQLLLREIRELGYRAVPTSWSATSTRGRADADRPPLSPRRATRILLTNQVTGQMTSARPRSGSRRPARK